MIEVSVQVHVDVRFMMEVHDGDEVRRAVRGNEAVQGRYEVGGGAAVRGDVRDAG